MPGPVERSEHVVVVVEYELLRRQAMPVVLVTDGRSVALVPLRAQKSPGRVMFSCTQCVIV